VASVFFNCQRENGCGGRRYIRWYWNNLLYRRTDGILHEAKNNEWVVNAGPQYSLTRLLWHLYNLWLPRNEFHLQCGCGKYMPLYLWSARHWI
jgi:hypothetical protein